MLKLGDRGADGGYWGFGTSEFKVWECCILSAEDWVDGCRIWSLRPGRLGVQLSV